MFGQPIKDAWFKFARLWCGLFCRVFFRIHFYGLENIPSEGPFILASNHQSFLDPLFCGIALKRTLSFMARDTLFKGRIFGPLLFSVNAIPVRRGQADIASIRAILEKLKQGKGVCLFPEATRTDDGKITSFKGGFTLLSRRGHAPIVPVLIDGAFECWPRHRRIFKAGSKITVTYGKPIPAEQIKETEDDDFAKLLTDTLRNMQSEIRSKEGKEPFKYS
ncbi:MAG: 1-acyl-sn-glycerol-3-phosphate acyltransferase [Sedimentisphaerales bacterium]|nr:1-acyl-sn-glycerol-3-phosphate acyltransferase [Sedimentisphaerales bacterium]